MGRALVVGTTLALCVLAADARALSAQRPSLDRVEELTRLGRPEEARTLLTTWWASERDDASRREQQRGLWLRGRLTVDPIQAELDFQRLVVLYPRGPYTAEAIFRLAQAAHALGDGDGAAEHVATLGRDFPRSEITERASAWLRTAGPAPNPPVGVTLPAPRTAAADTAVEDRSTPPVRTSAATDPPVAGRANPPVRDPATADPSASPGEGNYYVQLGAFAEEERALALLEEVRASGVEVRVVRVRGSGFLHVRHGRFVERQDAVEALEVLTGAGITAALVRDERPETRIRD